jgi:uncharacterized protein with PIN domain
MTKQTALLLFHGELRELLAGRRRGAERVELPVTRRASVKDAVEALGPPHTEIHRILFEGDEVDFAQPLTPGARVEFFPAAPPVDPRRPSLLRPPLSRIVFIVDANVGRLATFLRLLGLDAAYCFAWSDERLAELASAEGRIALSRDRALLKRKAITHGRLIRASQPEEQLREVVDFYGLREFAFFSRCLRCNEPLLPVPKNEIEHRLLPLTRKYYQEFHRCPVCERIYWPGSHHEKLTERMARLLG